MEKTIFNSTQMANLIEIIKEVKPEEYSKYSRIPNNHNRSVDEQQVKVLEESFSTFGTASAVIKVLRTSVFDGFEKDYIADGQHSVLAAMHLTLPLNVVIVKLHEDTLMNAIKYIVLLNNTAKSWSSNNYIKAFYHIPEYKIFDECMQKGGLTTTDMLQIFMGGASKDYEVKAFKNGEMKFLDFEDSYDMFENVVSVINYIPKKAFARRSLYKVLRTAKDYKKMCKAIIKSAKHLAKANTKFSENEQDFYTHLMEIYRAEFKIK
jgi:hypothetical protein